MVMLKCQVPVMFRTKQPYIYLCVYLFFLLGISTSDAFKYEAPQDCEWRLQEKDSTNVALTCKLRTINSDFDSTNFSVIQSRFTTSLRIVCSDIIFFQSSLANQSFENLADLKELEIEYCKIPEIPPSAFKGLGQLKNLTIRTHNTDWSAVSLKLKPSCLDPMPLLERLSLGENNIWDLPQNIFCSLSHLKYLNLTQNRLQKVIELGFKSYQSSNDAWKRKKDQDTQAGYSKSCDLTDLTVVDVSFNDILVLPPYGLSALGNLRELYLQNNKISLVRDHALKGLSALRVLNMSSNKLVALPPDLFSSSRQITEIRLENNSISVLAPGLFENLKHLVILDLSNNNLTSTWVTTGTFSGLPRLVILNLSNNNLTTLDAAVFKSLYSLQILHLEHNQLSSLAPNTFRNMSNLHTLVLSHNHIKELNAKSMNGLYVLSLLALDHNRIGRIHIDAFHNCTNLQDLNLSGNSLSEVPSALSPLQFLKTLDLGDNNIVSLKDAPFQGMSQLYGLRLINNNIGNISVNTFANMPALKILNLASNEIHHVEPATFDSNRNLQAIRLDDNELIDINGLFRNLPNLVWLNVSDNNIKWFDYALIPEGLAWLDLHKNRINELENYFDQVGKLKLTTLDASFNKLTEISKKSIPNSVELLFLNDNEISKVEPYTFFQNENLTRVDLYANQLVNLDLNALRLAPKEVDDTLAEFYIGGNPFQCDCTMEWLQRINNLDHLRQHPQVMDLDSVFCKLLFNRHRNYVPLVEADSSQFLCTYETHCFALCQCCMFDACDCEMTCPKNCTCYHDQAWSANIVDCSNSDYTSLPERVPMDATEVYLDGNHIKNLVSHAFIGRKNMQVLYLNNSNVEIIHNRTFNGLRALTMLHLENNMIRELRGFEFDHLEYLRELYLHNNRLSRIMNETFAPLKSLEILTLEGNNLVSFPVWVLTLNPYLVQVSLSENLWSCNCKFIDGFRTWVENNKNKVIDAESINCIQNSSLPLDLENAPHNLTACQDVSAVTVVQPLVLQAYLPMLLSTLGVFLVFIFIALAAFWYRHELRVWTHARCGLRICYGSTYDGDAERLFDAFVSYSSKDDTFVSQMLAPELEQGNPAYRLCLHYRDFPVSAYIADTIVEAVESSKRTILVLSKNFLQSEWCRFEFKSALHQVLRDRRKRLIVITVGDVPQRDMDPDIRLYLKTNTCLEWGEKLFWEKLRFAMPDVKPKCVGRNIGVERHYAMGPKLDFPSHSSGSPSSYWSPAHWNPNNGSMARVSSTEPRPNKLNPHYMA